MPNAVLERLRVERDQQIEFVDNTLSAAERDGRDLVDAEVNNIRAARERIDQIDAQIAPLVEFENLRETSNTLQAAVLGRRDQAPTVVEGGPLAPAYRNAGAFLVDYVRSRDPKADPRERAAAAERVAQARAVANQTTGDTPGILPEPIIGDVVNLLDASRPFITSIGAKDMGNTPGAKFYRPKITQHVQVGKQAAEKTQLPSRQMKIDRLEFPKETYGGVVDVSRQDIDWTSPQAWGILVQDLADVYAVETEKATATAFAAAVTQATAPVATDDLKGWATQLYQAAMLSYQGSGRLPNRIWASLDMWAQLGAIVDVLGRLVFSEQGSGGESSLTDFAGNMLTAPRIVVPSFPAKTIVVGPSTMFEYYEERIGLLSAVEPALLGVEVAYGGYAASGMLEANAFAKVTPPAGP